ncbi:hypothetical protein [Zoogloea sp.]|uniref:hypothetical protein n=1 Tax=Zoogloea sp. TaxID=49181 RepID=UPI0026196D4E|nr:hypothetical protein [Zoogloea sp.]MDD3353118.1 hypothetical protein [Zoogloea sp.]
MTEPKRLLDRRGAALLLSAVLSSTGVLSWYRANNALNEARQHNNLAQTRLSHGEQRLQAALSQQTRQVRLNQELDALSAAGLLKPAARGVWLEAMAQAGKLPGIRKQGYELGPDQASSSTAEIRTTPLTVRATLTHEGHAGHWLATLRSPSPAIVPTYCAWSRLPQPDEEGDGLVLRCRLEWLQLTAEDSPTP